MVFTCLLLMFNAKKHLIRMKKKMLTLFLCDNTNKTNELIVYLSNHSQTQNLNMLSRFDRRLRTYSQSADKSTREEGTSYAT